MRKAILVAVLALALAGLGCGWWASIKPSTIAVSVYFTYPGTTKPEDDNPERNVILPLIEGLSSGDKLDLAMYYLTNDDIKAVIMDAHSRRVQVRLYTERKNACPSGADGEALLEAGILAKVEVPPSYEMHHKFAVLDYADFGKTDVVITGSYNWTASANERNWENLVVIESPR